MKTNLLSFCCIGGGDVVLMDSCIAGSCFNVVCWFWTNCWFSGLLVNSNRLSTQQAQPIGGRRHFSPIHVVRLCVSLVNFWVPLVLLFLLGVVCYVHLMVWKFSSLLTLFYVPILHFFHSSTTLAYSTKWNPWSHPPTSYLYIMWSYQGYYTLLKYIMWRWSEKILWRQSYK